jgi:hypothetical protein
MSNNLPEHRAATDYLHTIPDLQILLTNSDYKKRDELRSNKIFLQGTRLE